MCFCQRLIVPPQRGNQTNTNLFCIGLMGVIILINSAEGKFSSSLRSAGTLPNDKLPKSSKHEAETNEVYFCLLTCWSAKCDVNEVNAQACFGWASCFSLLSVASALCPTAGYRLQASLHRLGFVLQFSIFNFFVFLPKANS